MAVGAVAKGDLVRSLLREESLLSRGVSLVARSLSRREESLLSQGVSLVARELLVARSLSLRGVSHCKESLIARSFSRREESLARSLSCREESLIERRNMAVAAVATGDRGPGTTKRSRS